jgi:hypothetical protein
MKTVDEILSASESLSAADLGRLRVAIERSEKNARAIVLKTKRNLIFRLYRQTDMEWWNARKHSLAIAEDYGFYIQMHLWHRSEEELNFAQLYLTLRHLSGESNRFLDDYKQAFSFPFAMEVIKAKKTYAYLLDVNNCRDSHYFTLRKMVEPDDPRPTKNTIQPPFEDEFGKEEIRYFISYFEGYLLGLWETLKPEQFQPFVRSVPAACIIFGFLNGKAFEEQFKSYEEYEIALKRFQDQRKRECDSRDADPSIAVERQNGSM